MGLWSDPGWPLLFWIQTEPAELILRHLKLALIWHFVFMPTLCSNSDTRKLLPGVLRLPVVYWTFYKKKQGRLKREDATELVPLQEERDLDSASPTWKVSACNFHIPRAHNYWEGQPIPSHPAEIGSLCSKAGKIHGPRRHEPLCRPG